MKYNKKFFILITLISIILCQMPIKSQAQMLKSRRALLIGNSNYPFGGKLLGPSYDIERMRDVLISSLFKESESPMKVVKANDLTKEEILEQIEISFGEAEEDDISYFYFAGHGLALEGVSYLIGVDRDQSSALLSSYELKRALDNIKGTKIIILDSCFSGGFIREEVQQNSFMQGVENIEKEKLEDFNQNFIEIFSNNNVNQQRRAFEGDKYKIITAASKDEYSYELIDDPEFDYGGEFTTSFIRGTGYSGNYLADKNQDGIVSLNEIHMYTLLNVKKSLVQAYPNNDEFPIVEYEKEKLKEISPVIQIEENTDFNIIFNTVGKYGLEILKEGEVIFSKDNIEGKKGNNIFTWTGKDNLDQVVEDGVYSLRIKSKNKLLKEIQFIREKKLDEIDIIYGERKELKMPIKLKENGHISLTIYYNGKISEIIKENYQDKEEKTEYLIDIKDMDIEKIQIKLDIF